MYWSGVTTSTFMIGSSNVGFAFLPAVLKAAFAHNSNDIESESTSWYEPSVIRTFMLFTGYPAKTPCVMDVSKPLLIAGINSFGMDPPKISFTNWKCLSLFSVNHASSAGPISNSISANLPRPPDCFFKTSRCSIILPNASL